MWGQCCDYDGCTGVPDTCDAKCAIVYNDFYDRCSGMLGIQNGKKSFYTRAIPK